MKTITDIRPSALIRELGWCQGNYALAQDGHELSHYDAKDLIAKGQSDQIYGCCLAGAIHISYHLGGITEREADAIRRAFKQIQETDPINYNDATGRQSQEVIDALVAAEEAVEISAPIPLDIR